MKLFLSIAAHAGCTLLIGFAATLPSACMVSTDNPHRLGTVKTAETATARGATARGDWQTAACAWFAIFEAGGEDSAQACVETARALCALGDPRSAKGVLDQGLARHPGDPDLLEMHGDLLCKLEFRRAAEESYLQALEVEPDRASTLLSLARLRIELGMENAALVPLRRRIELGLDDAATYELLSRAHAALGDGAAAFAACERAIESEGVTPERALIAAELCARDSKLRADAHAAERVSVWLTRVVELDPQNSLARHHLALASEQQGDEAAAIEHYRRAIEADPLFVPALTRLAGLHARRGEREQALEMARRALELEKNSERRAELQSLIAPPAPTTAKS